VIIRPAEERDYTAIRSVLLAAFPDSNEADLVERLRAGGFAEIELVAAAGPEIVGHILLSPMEAPFRALGLGPVSVTTVHQGEGIGGRLIEHGHAMARANNWQAIFLVGEPEYYERFGYSLQAAGPFECVYSGPYFMMLPLQDVSAVQGIVAYAPPFAELD
jgi:putative acetyltransferase